ncbi:hypothetical protein [Saccharothrix xinjiangensis]|uniref:Uncharacterized protein n=1 Tax=Saccharothrix xinjiangensis TaxID=204798 RepID=A0ABV9XTP5_9PSEU
MSHIFFRDSPDLAGLPEDAYDRLAPLGDLIDQSHGRSYHQNECGLFCVDPECRILREALLAPSPSTEDILGYLVAKDLLDLDAVEGFLNGGPQPALDPDDPLTDYAKALIHRLGCDVEPMVIEDRARDELGRELTPAEVDRVTALIRRAEITITLPDDED